MNDKIETAEDYKKLKTEVRQYLKDKVQPLVVRDFQRYSDIYPILYEIRQCLFMLDKQGLMNNYLKLRKNIESNEMAEKN
jgi:hypothetical protein